MATTRQITGVPCMLAAVTVAYQAAGQQLFEDNIEVRIGIPFADPEQMAYSDRHRVLGITVPDNDVVAFYNTLTGDLLAEIPGIQPQAIEMSRDGRHAVFGSGPELVRVDLTDFSTTSLFVGDAFDHALVDQVNTISHIASVADDIMYLIPDAPGAGNAYTIPRFSPSTMGVESSTFRVNRDRGPILTDPTGERFYFSPPTSPSQTLFGQVEDPAGDLQELSRFSIGASAMLSDGSAMITQEGDIRDAATLEVVGRFLDEGDRGNLVRLSGDDQWAYVFQGDSWDVVHVATGTLAATVEIDESGTRARDALLVNGGAGFAAIYRRRLVISIPSVPTATIICAAISMSSVRRRRTRDL